MHRQKRKPPRSNVNEPQEEEATMSAQESSEEATGQQQQEEKAALSSAQEKENAALSHEKEDSSSTIATSTKTKDTKVDGPSVTGHALIDLEEDVHMNGDYNIIGTLGEIMQSEIDR
jgi:hypothetical protein